MIKKLALAFAILVLAVAGAAYYFASNIDSLVKAVVERYGSEATQAQVTLKSVDLKPTEGSGSLQGLVVGNPKGFATAEAMSLGDIKVSLDISSLQSNPIVIKSITVTKPAITYEYGEKGSNLDVIQKNVQAYAAKFGGGKSGASSPAPASSRGKAGENERKVVIEDLTIRDGNIAISHTALQGRSLSAPLPVIHLTDIGKDKGGATPAEIAEKIIGTISAKASSVASADLKKQLGTLLKDKAGDIGGAAGGAAEKLKGLFGK
ncbi:MAG TPA: hypothetical protein VF194_16430 [Ferrovibrio sp.]|uniref:hypothetical protein n=1 Tax=Ferrovibrio sp. TaxID=1917215 RepID=UPI002ED2C028